MLLAENCFESDRKIDDAQNWRWQACVVTLERSRVKDRPGCAVRGERMTRGLGWSKTDVSATTRMRFAASPRPRQPVDAQNFAAADFTTDARFHLAAPAFKLNFAEIDEEASWSDLAHGSTVFKLNVDKAQISGFLAYRPPAGLRRVAGEFADLAIRLPPLIEAAPIVRAMRAIAVIARWL